MNILKKGFSLIELMVIVVIIGVLATIAIPAYEHYMIKSKMAHIIQVAGDARRSISGYRASYNFFPKDINDCYRFIADSDPYIKSFIVSSTNGAECGNLYEFAIIARDIYDAGVEFPKIKWAASANDDGIVTWTCTYEMPSVGGEAPTALPSNILEQLGGATTCSLGTYADPIVCS